MKPYACAQCGIGYDQWFIGRSYKEGIGCPRCGNQGLLARMTAAQQQEIWQGYQDRVKNTLPK